jgi:N-acetylglucosaminyldiphosphoundecaprenol N-acetyl-beta-D-mannosaminyltransferase
MKKQVTILGIPFDFVDFKEAADRAKRYAIGERFRYILTPNPEIVMMANQDEELNKAIQSADMIIPDGIGIVIASGLYGERLPERVAGFDLMSEMIAWGASNGRSFYLLGGKPGIVDRAKRNLEKVYPCIRIVGIHNGYFKGKEDEILAHINLCQPNILLVGMGAPLQEKWIFRNRLKINVNLAMGIGGSLDILAGKSKRAPKIFIKLGIEWFYRLMKEPTRIVRMIQLPIFLIMAVIESKMKKK